MSKNSDDIDLSGRDPENITNDHKLLLSSRYSPVHKWKKEPDIMDTSTPNQARRETPLIPLDDESPIAAGMSAVEFNSTSNSSSTGVATGANSRTGMSNEADSVMVVTPYTEPSPNTMDRRLAGGSMDVASGDKLNHTVP